MALATSSPILRKKGGSRRIGETLIRALCLACAALSILTTVGIVLTLALEGIHFFREISPLEFFFTTTWSHGVANPKYGVLPLVVSTFTITVGAGLISIPLGLLVAVYLAEYASARVRSFLKPALELLAGIPTVVYGFFGFLVVTPLLQKVIPNMDPLNAMAGAIVVGIMTLPMVASLCEDAIRAVPQGLREAAYGLGSTKFEVVKKVVIPSALSGVIAAFILALSRAIGETMAVTLAAGNKPHLTFDPRQAIETMTAFIVRVSKGDTPAGTTGYYTIFAVGLTLFAITFLMNVLANWLVRRYRRAY